MLSWLHCLELMAPKQENSHSSQYLFSHILPPEFRCRWGRYDNSVDSHYLTDGRVLEFTQRLEVGGVQSKFLEVLVSVAPTPYDLLFVVPPKLNVMPLYTRIVPIMLNGELKRVLPKLVGFSDQGIVLVGLEFNTSILEPVTIVPAPDVPVPDIPTMDILSR